MQQTKNTTIVAEHLIPTTTEAVRMYEENGGQLSQSNEFGIDPLVNRPDLYESRPSLFNANSDDPKEIFSDTVHGDNTRLEKCITLFYDITMALH